MAQTVSEAMLEGTLGSSELPGEPLPWYLDMMESWPTMTASVGTKAFRGSGTVIKGGSNVGQRSNPRATGWGSTREGMRQANYLNPRNWGRFGSQDYFHHTGALTGSKATAPAARAAADLDASKTARYNPFYMSAGVNAVGRGLAGESSGRVGQFLANTEPAKWMRKKELLVPGKEVVSKGFYSRVGAAGRMGWMSDARAAKNAGTTAEFLRNAGYSGRGLTGAMSSRGAAQSALLMSGTGTVSGRIGGFMAGAGMDVNGRTLQQAGRSAQIGYGRAAGMVKDIGLKPGQQYTARQMLGAGVKKGGAKAVGKGLALGGARVAGMAVPGLNIALTAWLVYDLAKLATKGVGHAASLGVEGFKSLRGDLNTGIMDRGFTDTEATMTSRSRGVQAIQNSRLNSRSILGAEAGAMYSHFG